MARGDALYRQWELLRTLQSRRRGIGIDELAERLEVNRRTVQRDLEVLATLFPVESQAGEFGKKFWRVRTETGGTGELQMTFTEMLSLHLSSQLLAPLAGTPFGDGLDSALGKLRAVLPTRSLNYFRDLDDALHCKSMVHADYTEHRQQIAALNRAIVHREAVRITYHSASQGREITSRFCPYGVVLLASSLYVIGHLDRYDEVRTLKVTRIGQVEETGEVFDRPADFSLADHTAGAFGVFGPGQRRRIRVRFAGWAATNLRENTWHPSQTITEDNGGSLTAEFELSSTVEFKRWLLGFGSCAKVLAPAELAQEIAEELRGAASLYTPPTATGEGPASPMGEGQ
jgi:predicted DNA-binding transcriptional regulator YafY